MHFTISATRPGSGWDRFGTGLTRGEARDITKRLQNAGASQIIVYAFSQEGEDELWQHVWHGTLTFEGQKRWDNLHVPTMTYYEDDLTTKSASQPYLDECAHGLSAWLCADPVNHYSDH